MAQREVVAEGTGLRWVLQEMSLCYCSWSAELPLLSGSLESRAVAMGGGPDGWCPLPGPDRAWGEHGAGRGLGTAPPRTVPLGTGQGRGAGHPDRAGAGCGGVDLAPGIPAPLHAAASGKVLFGATAPAGTALSATITSVGGKHRVEPRWRRRLRSAAGAPGRHRSSCGSWCWARGTSRRNPGVVELCFACPPCWEGRRLWDITRAPAQAHTSAAAPALGLKGLGLCGTRCPAPLGPMLQVAWCRAGYIQWKG